MAITQLRYKEQAAAPEHPSRLGRFVRKPLVGQADIAWHPALVCATLRERVMRQRPFTLWLTGLSGAGKSTIAYAFEKMLLESGHCCVVLDGDNIRHHLNSDLGFTPDDRRENIRRAAEVAHLMNEAGLIVIAAFISPFTQDRAMAGDIIGAERYLEVHVSTSTSVCERRDPKGLYAKARMGQIAEFTGVSAPYQAPDRPALDIDTEFMTPDAAAQLLFDTLADRKILA